MAFIDFYCFNSVVSSVHTASIKRVLLVTITTVLENYTITNF